MLRAKLVGLHQGDKQAKDGNLVRDWKRQKRKPEMLIRECFGQTGPGGNQRPPDSALQYS